MGDPEKLPFHRPYTTGAELAAIEDAVDRGHISSGGPYAKRCEEWLGRLTGSKCLLTPSCTAALEAMAMLIELGPGDEVIMPSYTFASTANAVVLRGATPVFIDVREDTLNIDESLIEDAITPATRAIAPVDYAGVGCEMDRIVEIAAAHELRVIEDAAQGLFASRHGKALGTEGDLGGYSFHESKHLTSGEGGVLIVNNEDLVEQAEILVAKGTNRLRFLRGEIDRYGWVDMGSSYSMSDLNAAFLWGQLEASERILAMRMEIWDRYQAAFEELEASGAARRPVIPDGYGHNAHFYYLLLPDAESRTSFLREMNERGLGAVAHYLNLHSAPAGLRFGRAHGELPVSEEVPGRIARLPLWAGMESGDVDRVIDATLQILTGAGKPG